MPADLARLRALLAAATPGPWRAGMSWAGRCKLPHQHHGSVSGCVYEPELMRLPGHIAAGVPATNVAGMWDYEEGGVRLDADATLIAEAVNALPALLDEVEALRAEVARLQAGGCARDQGLTQHCAIAAQALGERDEARAQSARLTDENTTLWDRIAALESGAARLRAEEREAATAAERRAVVADLQAYADEYAPTATAYAQHLLRARAGRIERGEHRPPRCPRCGGGLQEHPSEGGEGAWTECIERRCAWTSGGDAEGGEHG